MKDQSNFLARYAWWQGLVVKSQRRHYQLRPPRPPRYPVASVRGGTGGGNHTWHFRGELSQ